MKTISISIFFILIHFSEHFSELRRFPITTRRNIRRFPVTTTPIPTWNLNLKCEVQKNWNFTIRFKTSAGILISYDDQMNPIIPIEGRIGNFGWFHRKCQFPPENAKFIEILHNCDENGKSRIFLGDFSNDVEYILNNNKYSMHQIEVAISCKIRKDWFFRMRFMSAVNMFILFDDSRKMVPTIQKKVIGEVFRGYFDKPLEAKLVSITHNCVHGDSEKRIVQNITLPTTFVVLDDNGEEMD